MKLGLLVCDHVLDQFAAEHSDYDAMFRRWLGTAVPDAEWRVYDLTRGEVPDLAECDAWISTGSRYSVYDDVGWIHDFAAIVRGLHEARKPFLGVCFGHQMMAHALGGRVAKSPRGWGVGMHDFRVTARETWMRPPLETVSVLMSCQDQVEKLPEGAEVLASNDHCPVAIFRCGALLGIQGHPEWLPAYAQALIEIRRERIGEERAAAAIDTLGKPAHSREFAEWAGRWFHRSD